MQIPVRPIVAETGILYALRFIISVPRFVGKGRNIRPGCVDSFGHEALARRVEVEPVDGQVFPQLASFVGHARRNVYVNLGLHIGIDRRNGFAPAPYRVLPKGRADVVRVEGRQG